MKWHLLTTTGLVAACISAGGFAERVAAQEAPQEAAPDAAAPAEEGSADIMVTAQRRDERLYDVPITVNVVSGERIDRESLATIRDVIEQMPQVSFQQTGDQRTDTLSIRGISSVSNASGVEPDAAIVIDGETLARTMQMNYDAIDVERIEVLEGPQGTLFGKNAVAGLVNIVTRGPQLDTSPSGRMKIDFAEDNEYRVKASLNLPLTDNSALYLTGYGSYVGGWQENAHPGEPNGGQSKSVGFRAQYMIEPDPTLNITLKGEVTYKKNGIIPYAFKSLTQQDVIDASMILSGSTAMVPQFNALLQASGINLITPGGALTPIINGTLNYLIDDRNWGETNSHAFSVTVRKDLGNASIHYLGTYRYFNLYSNDNEYGIGAPQLGDSELALNRYMYSGPSTQKTVQQEVRIQSDTGGPFNYVAGAFYYYNDNYHREYTATCNDAVYGAYNGSGYPDPNPIGEVENFQCTGGYTGRYAVTDFSTRIKTHNEAFFGDVQYNLWNGLTVFAGARVLWEQQHMEFQHYPGATNATRFNPEDPFGLVSVKDKRNSFTHRIGAKYDFGNIMVYATHSTGFKGVSWSNYAQVSLNRLRQPLEPERPRQYEVGMRANLFNGKLDWQLSAFDLRNKHFQVRTILRDPNFQLAVVDAGTAHTKGIEFGINASPLRGVRIGGGYTYLPTATLLDDVLFPNRNGFINYRGARLPNAPKHSYNAYAQYSFNFPQSDLVSNVRLAMRRRGKQQSVLTQDPLQEVDAYAVVDGYYTLSPSDEKWSVTLYVKNLFNNLYYQRSYEPAALGWVTGQMAYLPRDYKRYVGGSINYKF